MKLYFFVITLILFAGVVNAQEKIENFNDVKDLDLSFKLKSSIILDKTENNPKLEYVKAKISFFPREDYRQKVLNQELTSNPLAQIEDDDAITYTWSDVDENNINKLEYEINSRVLTKNEFIKVTKNIKFPIRDLNNDLVKYTKATEFIDITPEIKAKAYELIGTETDLYKIVFKIADWTKNNIKYDLSTLTADVVQKSSWVLQNKEGVCDELTNLFISLLRSVDIPARFVSGVVYSNLDYKWGPHGWAEVYFPEYGWLPFDVTFGQYGWIDPSHIKLKDDADSGNPTGEYRWSAYGIDIDVQDIKLETSYNKIGEKIQSPLTMSIEPYKKAAAPGSFIPLLVTLNNPNDYYISTSVIVKKATDLTENNVKQVLLKPKETETIGWIMKIPSDVEEGYIYTATLEVTTDHGNIAESTIKYSGEYGFFSQENAMNIMSSLQERETKSSFTNLEISCSSDKDLYYSNETAKIMCRLKSQEDLNNIDFCIKDYCQTMSLRKNEYKDIEQLTEPNIDKVIIVAEDEKRVKYSYLDLNIIKIPELYIKDFKPNEVNFKDNIEISFTINSDSLMKDLELEFEDGHKLVVGDFKGSKLVTIRTNGRSLVNGLRFKTTYNDENNKQYEKREAFPVNVKNIPWYAKIILAILDLF